MCEEFKHWTLAVQFTQLGSQLNTLQVEWDTIIFHDLIVSSL